MLLTTFSLMLVLSQEPETPAPAAEAPAEAEGADQAKPAPSGNAPPPSTYRKGPADDVNRMLQTMGKMTPEERAAAMTELQKKYGAATINPVVPPADVDLSKFHALSEPEQAHVIARKFLVDLLAADTQAMASHSGLPFMLEDKRVDRAEDFRSEWSKHLRSKRTDLLSLFGIEVLTPADMEKKYGRPPARLNSWSWRNTGTMVAVANVGGHAAVLLLRQAGASWQVVGYHD